MTAQSACGLVKAAECTDGLRRIGIFYFVTLRLFSSYGAFLVFLQALLGVVNGTKSSCKMRRGTEYRLLWALVGGLWLSWKYGVSPGGFLCPWWHWGLLGFPHRAVSPVTSSYCQLSQEGDEPPTLPGSLGSWMCVVH